MSNSNTSSTGANVNFLAFQFKEPSVESHNFASDIGNKEFGNIGPVIVNSPNARTVSEYILKNPDQSLFELQRVVNIAANLIARHRDLDIRLQNVQKELESASTNLNEVQYEQNRLISEHKAEIKGAQKMFKEMMSTNKASSRPHPDPKFTGNDTRLLSPFIRDLRRKLEVNADWWDSERLRMFYVASCFPEGSIAKKTVDSGFKTNGEISYENVEDIIKLLKQTFGDVDEQETAQGELKLCFQMNQPLAVFLPNWLALAELSGFNDNALISFLKDAIHPEIKTRISYISRCSIPDGLPGYVAIVRQQDEILRILDPKYYVKNLQRLSAPQMLSKPAVSSTVVSPFLENKALTTAQGGDAMDLSCIQLNGLQLVSKWTAKDVGRRPVNDVEKAHRRAYNSLNNLCIICDSKDHVPRDCPHSYQNKKRRRPERVNSTVVGEDGNGKETCNHEEAGNV